MFVFAELFDEEAGIVETAALRNVGNRQIGRRKKSARAFNAIIVQIINRRAMNDRAETAAEVFRR